MLARFAFKLVESHDIPVIDKSKREDGTFSREDFRFEPERNIYLCPAGKVLTTTGHIGPDHAIRYQASLSDCRACVLKPKCCPKMPARRIVRDVNEDARDIARALAKTAAFERSRRYRKSVEMLFPHLKRILRLGRSSARLRVYKSRDICDLRVWGARARLPPAMLFASGRTREARGICWSGTVAVECAHGR